MPKISIILPVLNGDLYIEEAILSLVNQSFKDFELIILDNFCIDNTAMIAKKYADLYDNIFYYKTDLCLTDSLNKGFSLAKGEYWGRMSHDDRYLPHALERLAFELDEHIGIDVVYSDMDIIDEEGQVIERYQVKKPEQLIYGNCIGNCVLFRASIARWVDGFHKSEHMVEDYDFWLRFYQLSQFKIIPEVLFQYRRHSISTSAKFMTEINRRSIRLRKKYYNQFIKTRRQAAIYYGNIHNLDRTNWFRHLYLIPVFYYSPSVFFYMGFNRRIPEE